ncbi:MAG: polysaccharide pyruvyl transferase family protein [Armatimonadota bacterium]|nr:polysaccharide pyruvyl transferase family protein [Armatimonadota bacterium]
MSELLRSTDNPPFLFVGNGPYANRGCEAIAKTTVRIVRDHFPSAPIIYASEMPDYDQPDETEADVTHILCRCMPGFPSRLDFSVWLYQRLHLLKDFTRAGEFVRQWAPRCRAVLSMGGDLYGLSYGERGLIQYLFLGEAALAVRKPFIIWCATIGRLESVPRLKKWAMEHFRKCTLVLVRENYSLEYLYSNGVRDNVRLVADPAFLLEPAPPKYPLLLERPLSETIGFNLSGGYATSGVLGSYRDVVQLGADCVERILEQTGMAVVLVPHVVATPVSLSDNDTIFHCLLREALMARGIDVPLIPSWLRSWEIKWVLGQLRAYVGSRFHSTISSFSSCTPTVSLTFSEKGPALNEFLLGTTKFAIHYAKLTPEALMDKLNLLLEEEETVRSKLRTRIPEVQALSRLAGTYLAEVLRR